MHLYECIEYMVSDGGSGRVWLITLIFLYSLWSQWCMEELSWDVQLYKQLHASTHHYQTYVRGMASLQSTQVLCNSHLFWWRPVIIHHWLGNPPANDRHNVGHYPVSLLALVLYCQKIHTVYNACARELTGKWPAYCQPLVGVSRSQWLLLVTGFCETTFEYYPLCAPMTPHKVYAYIIPANIDLELNIVCRAELWNETLLCFLCFIWIQKPLCEKLPGTDR